MKTKVRQDSAYHNNILATINIKIQIKYIPENQSQLCVLWGTIKL